MKEFLEIRFRKKSLKKSGGISRKSSEGTREVFEETLGHSSLYDLTLKFLEKFLKQSVEGSLKVIHAIILEAVNGRFSKGVLGDIVEGISRVWIFF